MLLIMAQYINGQNRLSGRVVNEDGELLMSASVFLHGTEHAAATDEDGEFVLDNVPTNEYKLKVTYLGYKTHTENVYIDESFELEVVMQGTLFQVDEIEIIANALEQESPYAFTDLTREDIDVKDIGQDIPFLLEHTPSVVATSDAGAGIGYTYMRIRGTDPTGINVTINGVPLNDSESHSVFWVDLPDFSSSVDEIQIQRGVGPSTNGAGSFGGTIGLNTQKVNLNPEIKFKGTYGSFNTRKLSASISTGLINNKFVIDGRYSIIQSDGFIDRATSDLKSYYFSAAKIGDNHSLRFNVFSGTEVTYQAWNGVPEARINGTEEELLTHFFNNSNGDYNTVQDSINLFQSGRSFNAYTYENQVDDYKQDHYQLVYALQPSDRLTLNATAHYTFGRGFFETFRFDENLARDYTRIRAFADDTEASIITDANIVTRKWLSNDFLGLVFNSEYKANDDLLFTVGGAANTYIGDHFGRVIFVEGAARLNATENYYFNQSTKNDYNFYGKAEYTIGGSLNTFLDLQYRTVTYDAEGDDADNVIVNIDATYNFFNPKFGASYAIGKGIAYASYAVAQREPTRSDFVDANPNGIPESETLHDIEAGYRTNRNNFSFESNLYYQRYNNQLVVTGALNDVGAPIRTNVDDSYRLGIELSGGYQISSSLFAKANLTLSQNKIREFEQVIAPNVIPLSNTNIALSPSVVSAGQLDYNLVNGVTISWLSKYVGRQFLDNTSAVSRSLDPYWVNDLILNYNFKSDYINNLNIKLLVNNVLDTEYASNGYTYSYEFNGIITENYLYPQAGINFLLGLEAAF
jgi:iron complex outermembrane receptor protein